ncbi:MAG: 3-beta hydroxysteroid dehydrogenase, partial [Bacteroidetes bacterium]|nr:3-beta hydroxysteroid dehydrogenase [Fibrella sp.]
RAADIRLYITDNTKVTALTGWKPEKGITEIVTDIHAWLNENRAALEPILG